MDLIDKTADNIGNAIISACVILITITGIITLIAQVVIWIKG